MSGRNYGKNVIVGDDVTIGDDTAIGHNCIIEDGAVIGKGSYIDDNVIIRSGTRIGDESFIGANCIIGEYGMDFCTSRKRNPHTLTIGEKALIRSGSIIYTGSEIGDRFQTGHQVTIREKTRIGDAVSIGTLSDIQGDCEIGNYVRLHSNVHIGKLSRIENCVWIYPYVVLTNDPTPPSESFIGVVVRNYAIIATGSLVMPGIEIGSDALVAAGAIVTKNVEPYWVVAGNPAKRINDVRNVRSKITGDPVYPWREHFKRAMPWEDSDFESWYHSLALSEKERYSPTYHVVRSTDQKRR